MRFVFVRIAIAHFHSYPAVLMASMWIGLNKGLRTVFMALVMPSYVPLERLPAATGLQLLFAGFFYFTVGPVVGECTNGIVAIRTHINAVILQIARLDP